MSVRKLKRKPQTLQTSSFLAIVLLICAFYLAWSRTSSGEARLGTLEVEFHGLRSSTGVVAVALFNSKDGYDTNAKAFQRAFLIAASDIRQGRAQVRFESIPFGSYAIVAFHDENKNGDLDRSYVGLPTEDYGFSNDVSAFLGRPSYQRARFEVARQYQLKRIRLH